jgi:flagellar basal-body rod modification protein FlgD
MSVSASVIDGVLQQTVSTSSSSTTSSATNSSTLDKDAFLQLLVAQMKYQDPLEPTSNTEYISQYATFSELEQMQNMSSTMELSRAANLVGQTVVVDTTDSNGTSSTDMGVVDYITYENSKALVWINGSSYSLDDVVEVADPQYIEAYSMALTLVSAVNKLPTVANLGIEDKDAVNSIQETYDSMNEYQQSFVASDIKDSIQKYVDKMQEIIKLSGADADNNSEVGEQ